MNARFTFYEFCLFFILFSSANRDATKLSGLSSRVFIVWPSRRLSDPYDGHGGHSHFGHRPSAGQQRSFRHARACPSVYGSGKVDTYCSQKQSSAGRQQFPFQHASARPGIYSWGLGWTERTTFTAVPHTVVTK